MNRIRTTFPWLLCFGCLTGCGGSAPTVTPREEPPTVSRSADLGQAPVAARSDASEFSWETERDRPFADFLRQKSGGMIHDASVGIERQGKIQIVLDRSVAPDETLDLTKSVMAGARKDFPDRPITLAVFDPSKTLILRAIFKLGQGVSYKLADDTRPESTTPASTPGNETTTESAPTRADRKFAAWAEEHGKSYLRYVEADLERHGRLWFGVTQDVKPADVPNLTKSLLEGAHREFPQGELVATVFDPEGGKIGKATLARDGSISWQR